MFERSGSPQESWSLDDLASFVRRALRRNAVEAWETGRALLIAQRKLKDEKRFEVWVKKEIQISKATAWRYRKIAEMFTHEDVQQRTLQEVYERLEQLRGLKVREDQQSYRAEIGVVVHPEQPKRDVPPITEEPEDRNVPCSPVSDGDDHKNEMPKWATRPKDDLRDDEGFDLALECDEFIKAVDDYRASGEWTFTNTEDTAQLREKLSHVLAAVAKVMKLLKSTKAA